jgi:hypothetical protein
MAVELNAKPHLTEHLAIRLPKGWNVDQEGDDLPVSVSAVARTREGPIEDASVKELRLVGVYQTVAASRTAAVLLGSYLSDQQGELGTARPFSILGSDGVVARFEAYHADEAGRIHRIPSWYAAAVVPGAGPGGADLGVVLTAQGLGTDGPAGRRLLRQVADGLSVRGH